MRTCARVIGTWSLAAVAALFVAAPAAADVSEGCDGMATILGVAYTPDNDTAGNPIVIPKDEDVLIPWEGSTTFDNNNHSGEITLVVGPFNIAIGDWADNDPSTPNAQGSSGEYDLEDFYENDSPFGRNIVGLYEVAGSHTADGGSCVGNAMIQFEGSVLSTPIGAGSLILIIITAGGIAIASIARKQEEA